MSQAAPQRPEVEEQPSSTESDGDDGWQIVDAPEDYIEAPASPTSNPEPQVPEADAPTPAPLDTSSGSAPGTPASEQEVGADIAVEAPHSEVDEVKEDALPPPAYEEAVAAAAAAAEEAENDAHDRDEADDTSAPVDSPVLEEGKEVAPTPIPDESDTTRSPEQLPAATVTQPPPSPSPVTEASEEKEEPSSAGTPAVPATAPIAEVSSVTEEVMPPPCPAAAAAPKLPEVAPAGEQQAETAESKGDPALAPATSPTPTASNANARSIGSLLLSTGALRANAAGQRLLMQATLLIVGIAIVGVLVGTSEGWRRPNSAGAVDGDRPAPVQPSSGHAVEAQAQPDSSVPRTAPHRRDVQARASGKATAVQPARAAAPTRGGVEKQPKPTHAGEKIKNLPKWRDMGKQRAAEPTWAEIRTNLPALHSQAQAQARSKSFTAELRRLTEQVTAELHAANRPMLAMRAHNKPRATKRCGAGVKLRRVIREEVARVEVIDKGRQAAGERKQRGQLQRQMRELGADLGQYAVAVVPGQEVQHHQEYYDSIYGYGCLHTGWWKPPPSETELRQRTLSRRAAPYTPLEDGDFMGWCESDTGDLGSWHVACFNPRPYGPELQQLYRGTQERGARQGCRTFVVGWDSFYVEQ